MAHNEGLDVDKAREVPRWRESDVFTPLEREVLEYAEAMSQHPADGDRRDGGRPARRSSARRRCVELTAVIAFANLTTRAQRRARDRVGGLRGRVRPQAAGASGRA